MIEYISHHKTGYRTGATSSFYITAEGQLYVCGNPYTDLYYEKLTLIPVNDLVIDVVKNYNITFIITTEGTVWTMGRGIETLTLLPISNPITSILRDSPLSAFLCSDSGDIYTYDLRGKINTIELRDTVIQVVQVVSCSSCYMLLTAKGQMYRVDDVSKKVTLIALTTTVKKMLHYNSLLYYIDEEGELYTLDEKGIVDLVFITERVKDLSMAHRYPVMLTEKGNLYKIYPSLSLIASDESLSFLHEEFIITSNGDIASIAYRDRTLEFMDMQNVESVTGGSEHYIVGTTDGKYYGYGSNYYGQLGLGKRIFSTNSQYVLLTAP